MNSPGPARPPPVSLLPTFAAFLLVLISGLATLAAATNEGNAFTTETLRRSQVARQPMPVPDFQIVDAQGRPHRLSPWLRSDGRVWIIDFVYPRCTTLCLALGSVFQQLQQRIVERGLQDRIGLLSISFDPAGDGPDGLRAYAARMRMQPGVWQVVGLTDALDRRRLLDSFGIMVIPAPLGEFEHNAALHVIDGDARLVRILDIDEPGRALEAALHHARPVSSATAAP